jgi:hypothetical protein
MEVVPIDEVIDVSSDVVFGDCSIDIADDKFVIIGIEVDFRFDFASIELVDDLIESEVQM